MAFLCLFQLQRVSLTLHEHRHLSLHECDSPACVFWLTCQSTSFISCGSRCSCWNASSLCASGAVFLKLHGLWAGSRKVRLSLQFKVHNAGFGAGYHWPLQWEFLIPLPTSSIITESPVMTPDIQWSYGCEGSLKTAEFHIRSRSESRTWLQNYTFLEKWF